MAMAHLFGTFLEEQLKELHARLLEKHEDCCSPISLSPQSRISVLNWVRRCGTMASCFQELLAAAVQAAWQ